MKDQEDNQELHHEPVPGYRTAFYIILGLAAAYLAYAFIWGGQGGVH